MHNTLAVAAGLVALSSSVPYILNTLRGKTHPNLVSWFTWMLLHAIAASAAFASGAVQTGIFTSAAALSTGFIVLMSLRYGIRRYTRFDALCQAFAFAGIVAWRFTDRPVVAIVMVMAVNLMAALPTIRHAWQAPQHETWQTFALSVLASSIVLASITHYDFVSLAYPIYFFACDAAIAVVILARRRRILTIIDTMAA
ncbi:MAG TPA: hypothetical protein VLH86_02740 [Patescibacteria group bacterium]|nr:hypothetical protein [Patescibacteria group bacterium]